MLIALWVFCLFWGSFKAFKLYTLANIKLFSVRRFVSLDCSNTLDRSENLCPDDYAIFHCIVRDGADMGLQIISSCGNLDYRTAFSSSSPVGCTGGGTLCSTTSLRT